MKKSGTRSGRVGILLTVVLMFCVVMFVGTLFWLITDTGFLVASTDTSLFKAGTMHDDVPRTLNQTIATLQDNGCMVLYYSKEYTGGYELVTYEVFIKKAVAARIAYRVNKTDNETVLLVETPGGTLEWVPEG